MKKKIFAFLHSLFSCVSLFISLPYYKNAVWAIQAFFSGIFSTFPSDALFLLLSHLMLILSSLIFLYQAFEKEIKKLLNVDEWKARAEERKRVKREREKEKLQAQIETNKAKLQEMEKAD